MATIYPTSPQQQTFPPSDTPPDHQSFGEAAVRKMQRTSSSQNNSQHRASNRMSGDFSSRRSFSSNGNGNAMPVPGPATPYQNGHARNGQPMSAVPPFEMARSPPNPATKNTKHVPCKFFRQGACQAGQACPFLHSTDNTIDSAPCKYFTKGNCKFGAKCALAHILPDGRRVNRNNLGMAMGGGQLNLGGRVNPPAYHPQDSVLANSLLSQQQINGGPYSSYSYMMGDEYSDRLYDGMSPIDIGPGSNPASKYGSPTEDSRMPLSPMGHHLSALDVQLPASFDSNGISYIARHGPVAASVPSKFAHDSPSASLPSRNGGPPSDAIKALHDTAYGNMRNISANLASSPSTTTEENHAPRMLHSQRLFRSNPVSASLPRPGPADDWDEGFALEEDLLPTNLHDDVLTPQEKARRTSRSEQESGHAGEMAVPRGIPSANSSKVGSPIASSPSRFASLFAKQRQQKEADVTSSTSHVGSPLRESLLSSGQRPGAPVSMGTRFASGDSSPALSSPPRQLSMSTLSQQMQSMRLKRTESGESNSGLHPAIARHSSSGGRFDRTISSPRLSTTRIDEEVGDLVFSMEEEDTHKRHG